MGSSVFADQAGKHFNGKLLHENVEMKGAAPGRLDGKEKPKGPLMFQGNHGPVAYRNNIVVRLLK